MIPKKIHYCWFGKGKKGKLFKKCYRSWKKFFPDYEIIEWNEENFDINCNTFVKEAYEAKLYAFVSDYARLKILYNEGGIYFDTDVEVLKSFDDDILKCGYFAKEEEDKISTGLGFSVPPKNIFIKYMAEDYEEKHLKKVDGTLDIRPCPVVNTESLEKRGIIVEKVEKLGDITIYGKDYFCGFDVNTNHYIISDKTYTVHHYAASWNSNTTKIKRKLKRILSSIIGINNYNKLRNIKTKRRKRKDEIKKN